MKALLIHLELKSPLLLTQIGNGDENSSLSQAYIPGGVLRGALIARYLAGKPGIPDLLQDETAQRLFFSDMYYLNAYPTTEDDLERTLPVPASWRKEKGVSEKGSLEIVDEALSKIDEQKDTRLETPFCVLAGEEAVLTKPEFVLNLHIAGEGRGSVKRNQNTLYQYQALAGGQSFTAAILSEKTADLEDIGRLLNQSAELALGRSRSTEYGLVQIAKIEPQEGCLDNWVEAKPGDLDRQVTITFLSSTLLRDENGQPTLDFDGFLGRSLTPPRQVANDHAFINSTLVGGFNRKWGLPLPQRPAIGAGSVFTYPSSQVKPSELRSFVEHGMGERLAEGYGRIAVNWQAEKKLTGEGVKKDWKVVIPDLSPASKQIARQMSERLLRRMLDERLVEKAQKLPITGRIQNHQLGRLRSVARTCLTREGCPLNPVSDFLDSKNLKETARKQFETARIGGQRLYYWVIEVAKSSDALKEYLEFDEAQIPVVAGEKAPYKPELKNEYTLRLIEAVIDSKMKHNRQEG